MALNIKSNFDLDKNIWNVSLNGEVDVYTADILKDTLSKLIKERKESIKINGTDLQYIDSTGLGVLIGIYKKINVENKQIIVTNIKPSITKLFKITGLDKIFKLEE
ncbi:STAS domain-containing protein [Serpentinicella sp. ANB-PHB4]|uniref:STAS domain-containing protein n=1 Tax=Serpentinicella sp. ANB-PHB4 TaxID=3074076 RepID=UPI00285D874F|nr:STAS domain-containing protein [Serpentinicella sp. ANB-PHB4]MDR5658920.1 STAS domain-containing protein [Serpentinicella sp. ANB-PHB4]